MDGGVDELQRQSQACVDLAEVVARLRHAGGLDSFFHECAQTIQEVQRFRPCDDLSFPARWLRRSRGRAHLHGLPAEIPGIALSRLRHPEPGAHALPDQQAAACWPMWKPRWMRWFRRPCPNGDLLDQSHCMLRGLSPVHLSYLRNMGVRATMTLSIVCAGKLWGLIACHHHQPITPPHQIREGMRQVCELLAEIANMRIEALSHLEAVRRRLDARPLAEPVSPGTDAGRRHSCRYSIPGCPGCWRPSMQATWACRSARSPMSGERANGRAPRTRSSTRSGRGSTSRSRSPNARHVGRPAGCRQAGPRVPARSGGPAAGASA